MPPQQSNPPDFIPASASPDFIPDPNAGGGNTPTPKPSIFDRLTELEPANKRPGLLGHVETGLGNVGAGFMAPLKLLSPNYHMPVSSFESKVLGVPESKPEVPDMAAGIESGIGAAGLLGGADEAIPSTSRAAARLNAVEEKARNVPVGMTRTVPALQDFKQSVNTGGLNSTTAIKLANRIRNPQLQPPNFPEARDFYSNISNETKAPGFLRRAIENPKRPALRYNLGNVRTSLNSDLVDAAESNQPGQGKEYLSAQKEYGRGAKLNKALGIGGLIAGEEALRRSGLLGTLLGRAVNAGGGL